MSFFEPPDPRALRCADPATSAAVGAAFRRHAIALALCCAAAAGGYASYVAEGLHEAAATGGTIAAPGLRAPVTIVRDGRDVPHIRAGNDRDLYFAEGYVQASDRLFQLDLTRRYAYGRLAEVLGAKALALDEAQRAVDVDAIARRQLRAMSPRERDALVAFSDGVNAAAAQPLPVEFRMLLYRPAPWTPKDSIAVSVVASLALAEPWHDVFVRDVAWRRESRHCFDALFPLSDARYDVTVDGARVVRRSSVPASNCDDTGVATVRRTGAIGSNAWAAGAARARDGRALVANDPHLDLTIPGIWYLVDIESPDLHAAGATIPGIPGVVLGHNERVAWASTNAEMTTASVFHVPRPPPGARQIERFHVRFAPDATAAYYRTARDFSVPDENDRDSIALVRWPIYAERRSTIATVFALDRARSAREALAALARYRGSPQNFIVADARGEAAFHVAGLVPNDPAWGRYVHRANDLRRDFAPLPFAKLPGRAPDRDAVLLSANNAGYDRDYPYRLSAQFDAPYRAYRIGALLRARRTYDAAYFEAMQLDTLSPIDLEIARALVRLARAHPEDNGSPAILAELGRWDGRFAPDSRAAALEHAIRAELFDGPTQLAQLSELRTPAKVASGAVDRYLDGALPFGFDRRTWRDAGGTRVEHPLAPMNFAFLNGAWLPGAGDEYTIHLQEPGFAQGFRAVWDVGDWDRGGIAIPSGESGEPGSRHYTDLTNDWVRGLLQPLPFSDGAVRRSAARTLVLRPQ